MGDDPAGPLLPLGALAVTAVLWASAFAAIRGVRRQVSAGDCPWAAWQWRWLAVGTGWIWTLICVVTWFGFPRGAQQG